MPLFVCWGKISYEIVATSDRHQSFVHGEIKFQANHWFSQNYMQRFFMSLVKTSGFFLWQLQRIFTSNNGKRDIIKCSMWLVLQIPYLPVYKSTFYSLKICPKNRPRLIHGSKTEIKKSSGQISIIIVSYGNKHPLLHDTSYGVFSLINLSSWS